MFPHDQAGISSCRCSRGCVLSLFAIHPCANPRTHSSAWAGTVGMPTGSPSTRTNSKPMPPFSPRCSNSAGNMPSSTKAGTWATLPARPSRRSKYLWNGNGLLIPDPGRFPSAANGAGFKPLADWVHAQGLKFGIHIVRGIPRQVVAANLPIAGTHSMPPTPPTPHLPAPGTKATGASKTMPPAKPITTPC